MSALTNSGKHIDAFRLAKEGQVVEGEFAVGQMHRLDDVALNPKDIFKFKIQGIIGDKGWPGAVVNLNGVLELTCYRCNQPMRLPINREVVFRFAKTLAEANSIPIEEDDETEVIVGSSKLNILDWLEEEILLCIPIVPMHEADCRPEPLLKDETEEKQPNPFAQLKDLKGLRKSK